jgi:Tol biopolymer transport system component
MMVRKHALHASLLLALVMSAGIWMSQTTVQGQTAQRCFAETNYCIEGRIREFWEQNGGLDVFGFPITPQVNQTIEGVERPVQWFERNRLELHAENARPYDVLLGRLGADVLEQQGRNWFAFPTSEPQQGCRYFAETGHNICEPFLGAWRSEGLEFDGQPGTSEAESLALFGMPLSDAQMEVVEGNSYMVQYFERARFEHHPDNPPNFQVLLGLLGTEVLIESAKGDPGDVQGEQIAFTTLRDGNQDIYICPVPGPGDVCSTGTRLTNIPQDDGQPTWSPDGSQIAFESNLDGDWEIYSIFANGSSQTQLSSNGATDGAPSWAARPDGWYIAFHSDRDGEDFDIYLMDSADVSRVARLTSNPANDRHPALSPDGSRIAFASARNGPMHIYVADVQGSGTDLSLSGLTNLTEGMAGESENPVWSPDGSRLVFEHTHENNAEIYVVNADGTGGLQNLTSHDAFDGHPTWSPDGSRIAFHTNREGGVFTIYMMNADGSGPVKIISHDPANIVHPAWLSKP